MKKDYYIVVDNNQVNWVRIMDNYELIKYAEDLSHMHITSPHEAVALLRHTYNVSLRQLSDDEFFQLQNKLNKENKPMFQL